MVMTFLLGLVLLLGELLAGEVSAQIISGQRSGGGISIGTGTDLPATCTPGTSNPLFLDTDDEILYVCTATDTFSSITETDTLHTVFTRGNSITGANSFNNAVKFLDANGDGFAFYTDATDGPTFVCVDNNVENACTSYTRKLASGQTLVYKNSSGTNIFTLTESTNALTLGGQLISSGLGVELTESDTNPTCSSGNYSIYADTSEARIKKCVNGRSSDLTSYSILFPLNPRGATLSNLESITSNVVGDYYLTFTDANTDAADFQYIIPSNSALIGATTATFKLVGVSKNASPSGNIDFDCAITAFVPGTDTLVAHSTTGEVTALLTPATQYREVAVTTSAHTINGGTLAAGDKLHGSCEIDASATTSAQMSDFRLWGWVLVTFN